MTRPPSRPDAPRILYAIRHGESLWNVEGRLAGWSDIALTQIGRAQASALRPLLQDERFDSVWSSPLQRARETARLAWGERFQEHELLKEFNFGAHEGRRVQELSPDELRRFRAFETYHAPEGEAGHAFGARVDQFIESLPSGQHLVFTHGGVIRRLFAQVGIHRFPKNAGVHVFDLRAQTLIREIPNPLLSKL